MIRRWLVVPLSAAALVACGSEETPKFSAWTLDELPAEEGFSLRSPEFTLGAGEESQNCYFVRAPDLNGGQDYFVSRVHIAQNPGTHHLNVFRVKTIEGLDPSAGMPMKLGQYDATLIEGHADFFTNPCWNSANWADWPLVANSQESSLENPYTDWKLPEGVGIRFSPGEMLMVQSHYVNYGAQTTPYGVRVGVNFHRVRGAEPMEMGSLFATQQSIRVCQSTPAASFSGTCRFPRGNVTIEAVNGHFHSRGKKFSVYSWDGVTDTHPSEDAHIYTSNAWDDPPMKTNVGVQAPQGTGVWWDCEYKWTAPTERTCDEVNAKDPQKQGDCCYTFGGNVDVGEHCNLFMYYYPRVESTDVFCN